MFRRSFHHSSSFKIRLDVGYSHGSSRNQVLVIEYCRNFPLLTITIKAWRLTQCDLSIGMDRRSFRNRKTLPSQGHSQNCRLYSRRFARQVRVQEVSHLQPLDSHRSRRSSFRTSRSRPSLGRQGRLRKDQRQARRHVHSSFREVQVRVLSRRYASFPVSNFLAISRLTFPFSPLSLVVAAGPKV